MKPILSRILALLSLAMPSLLAAPGDCVVVFHQVMYHPQSDTEPEWIELRSLMYVDVDMSGWRLADGVDFLFPEGTVLKGGESLIVASDPAKMPAGSFRSLGPWKGSLANEGEKITLRNNSNRVMDELSYSDETPWPKEADGGGPSLIKTHRYAPTAEVSSWRATTKAGGEPNGPSSTSYVPPTPIFQFGDSVVINELMYHPRPGESEWLELRNSSSTAVDLSGWKLRGDVDFDFGQGTSLPPGGYLVLAKDKTVFVKTYPGVAVLGDFSGQLGNSGGELRLLNASGALADELRYFDGGEWDWRADGHGPSLELRDPRADNSRGASWQASDEAAKSTWKTYTYRALATTPVKGAPTVWQELALGTLTGAGEILLDDIKVIEAPGGSAVNRIQNGDFSDGLNHWRVLGNHRHTVVVDEGGNPAMKLSSNGATEYQWNQIETTFGEKAKILVNGEYEISFRARWLAGCSRLNTRLYFNRAPMTTQLDLPPRGGTPGARNSRAVENAGPTFAGLHHSPLEPAADKPTLITVSAADPDGLASLRILYKVEGGLWAEVPMTGAANLFRGEIPGQAAGTLVQFYVEAEDKKGARASYPAGGESSRALYRHAPATAPTSTPLQSHSLGVLMLTEEAAFMHKGSNALSNDRMPCTIYYGGEAAYDSSVRLKGSFVGRDAPRVGFNLEFPPEKPLRGIHRNVAIDRSTHADIGVDEVIIKHIATRAGDIPGMYDDLLYFQAPRTLNTGPALMRMAGFDDIYLDSQYDKGSNGTVYEYEVYRWATSTSPANNLEAPKRAGGLDAPNGFLNIAFQNFGDNKEDYRWHCLITSNRDQDDYSVAIPFMKAFSLPSAEMAEVAPKVMDVDSCLRTLAYQTLMGPADATFTGSNEHNFRLYARPDGKMIYLPWDWDSSFQLGSSAPLIGGGPWAKLIRLPGNTRRFHGHILDIVNQAMSDDYLTTWIAHYGERAGRSFATRRTYLSGRAKFAKTKLLPQIPFEITTNSGANLSVEAPQTTLEGKGWVDVAKIMVGPEELSVTWLNDTDWRASVPLQPGANAISLTALNHRGQEVGKDAITITQSGQLIGASAANVGISEIMYDPGEGGVEFIEILNRSAATLDLSGAKFTRGIEFTFPADSKLGPSARLILAEDIGRYRAVYPTAPPPVGAFANGTRLSNQGERLTLADAAGRIIADIDYSDKAPWPTSAAGQGRSLVFRAGAGADPGLASHWWPSAETKGSPGEPGLATHLPSPGATPDQVRREILTFTLGPRDLRVERVGRESVLLLPVNLRNGSYALSLEASTDLKTWIRMEEPRSLGETTSNNGQALFRYRLPDGIGYIRARADKL